MRRLRASALLICSLGLTSTFVAGRPAHLFAQERRVQPPAVPETATEPGGWIGEPDIVERAAIFGDRHLANGGVNNGWYADFGKGVPGAGWINIGPGYRYWFDKDRALFDASATLSWRGYKTAQVKYERLDIAGGKVVLGSQYRWQDLTQVVTFGSGPASLRSSLSEYRLKSSNVVGYAALRPTEWLTVGANLGWLQPSVSDRAGAFLRDRPDTRAVFPRDVVFTVADQPAFVYREASITADTRDFPGHTTRGGLFRASAGEYADRDAGLFGFRRYELEGAQFVPFADSGVVLALHGWLVATSTSDGAVVPFYLQPSLGGQNSLRSFADYRFHDRNLLVFNAEVRVPLMTHVDAAGFVDMGNVAASLGDLDVGKRSYGAGLRLHSRRQTFARIDLARGGEGWRFMFRLTDPLNLARVSRKTASVPSVP